MSEFPPVLDVTAGARMMWFDKDEAVTIASRLPTIEGRVHGIVGWAPVAVQCDDCLRVWSGGGEALINTLRRVTFNRRAPGPRLCIECWQKRGWKNTTTKGWIKL
jgi:hypothetical protein